MKRESVMVILRKIGFNVSTTEDFGTGSGGIWVKQALTPDAINMWEGQHGEDLGCHSNPHTVDKTLRTIGADDWHVEWHDHGTMMIYN